MPLRVAILHHAVSSADSAADQDVLVQAEMVENACHRLGHETIRWACGPTPDELPAFIAQHQPDVCFQLVEKVYGSDKYTSAITSILSELKVPFTGSGSAALDLSNDKVLAKQLLCAANLPTPRWVHLLPDAPPQTKAAWLLTAKSLPRFILKPVGEHSSVGMDDSSVIQPATPAELLSTIEQRSQQAGHPFFAEEFISGREFNLSLLAGPHGPQVLPPAEIDFSSFPADKPHIVNYAAKWEEASFEFQHTLRQFDFPTSDRALLAELGRLAVACWRIFGLKGYVRVDFRVDRQDQPWILEVNTNPCLSPDAGYAAAVRQAGISMEAAIARILDDALQTAAPSRRTTPGRSMRRTTSVALRLEPINSDRDAIRRIVESTGLFRPAEIDIAVELVDERLTKGVSSGYEFVFAELDNQVIGYACFGHNSMTVASFDLYWICVAKAKHGLGVGRALLAAAEEGVRLAGGIRLYIETSTRPDYLATRGFYLQCGYHLEAALQDFYAAGDGKATFVKAF